jgi:predicted adenine nucleotide alpha hydrolase (AANH) superfamily ATPase
MLVHICCSIDSHYFLQQLQKDMQNKEELVGFFYNPNIQPKSEHDLRLQDVKYSCAKLGIKLIEGDYNYEAWYIKTKSLANEPERGERCSVCYDDRLENSCKQALKEKHKSFTSTLLMSSQKSQEKLIYFGDKLAKQYKLKFIFKDYRKNNGIIAQNKIAKNTNLYRQDTCGCFFAYNKHFKHQTRSLCDMYCNIGAQVLPNSIEDRLKLFNKRDINSQLIKQKFKNYRLKTAYIKKDKITLPSYFLCYSTTTKANTKTKVFFSKNGINYLGKDSIIMIDLYYFNKISKSNYKNVKEIIYNPLSFKKELKIRIKILNNKIFDTSCIVIVDCVNIDNTNYEIYLDYDIFDDFRQIDLNAKKTIKIKELVK